MARFVVFLAFLLTIFSPVSILAESSRPQLQVTQQQSQTVYITRTGKKYHRAGCRYLSHSSIPVSLKEAQANGYAPCSVCHPPQ